MRHLTEIIVHCAATKPGWMKNHPTQAKVAEIDKWHRSRGWSGVGYHAIIDRDGTVLEGRSLGRNGAHVKGHNTGTVGVCLIGGYGSNENDTFDRHFTKAQDRALRKYISGLRKEYPSITKVTGHNQYAAKACPGFRVPEWYGDAPAPSMRVPAKVLKSLVGPVRPSPLAEFFRALRNFMRGK